MQRVTDAEVDNVGFGPSGGGLPSTASPVGGIHTYAGKPMIVVDNPALVTCKVG